MQNNRREIKVSYDQSVESESTKEEANNKEKAEADRRRSVRSGAHNRRTGRRR